MIGKRTGETSGIDASHSDVDRVANLLFILPSLVRGGAEIQTLDLVNGLSPSRCRKHLLCFDPGTALRDRVDEGTVTFHSIVRRRKFDMRVARLIASIIDEHEIDVVHCSLLISLFWGWLGVRLSRRRPRLVTTIHTTIYHTLKMEILDRLVYRHLLRRCHLVIFVCQNQRDYWCKRMPFIARQAIVIYNGIDTGYFQPANMVPEARVLRASLKLPPGPVLVHVAGLRPEKGHAVLFQALRQVMNHRADVQLLVAGDGPLRLFLESEVERLGIRSNVHFLGAVADVRPLLLIADFTVLPSTSETFSMAMLESLAMEIPVIGSDTGGMGEAVIHGQTGYLVQPGDIHGLAQAIRTGLEDSELRQQMGIHGRQLVVSRYDRKSMVIQTEAALLALSRQISSQALKR